MPANRGRRFSRPLGKRRYKKLFLLAVEGAETEPAYFAMFNDDRAVIRIECLRGTSKSSPPDVLKRMMRRLKEEFLRKTDEAWLVVHKDEWTDDQLALLHAWTTDKANQHLALSNPRFEYWLLLHFEDGRGIGSARECEERLRKHLPEYRKDLDTRRITSEKVRAAVDRAKWRDTPRCEDWPHTIGTTVYRLVESVLNS